ncbi:hypothetical protein A8C32_02580 [Flavivirga aquatica]|uniref:BIG2 domain-containing protein n=1 Tax=Flavivirga aquatica TaxID=1849968 RepID=A0A1E5TAD5_9FLAO|nr:Ig-like domain-containing protein [Flavivirga aquatica]OEK08355.1 hypothetical protein A8C32_02580 [Flavivirga aquatica]
MKNKLLLLGIFLISLIPESINGQVLWEDDFSASNWQKNYDISHPSNFKYLPTGSSDGSGCVEITINKGSHHGGSMRYMLMENLGYEPEELYAEYRVMYDGDMKTYGGKGPGFSGTYDKAGWGNEPGYGKAGWSARGGVNCDNQPYTKNSWYVYHTYTNYDASNCPGSTNYRSCNPFPYDVSNPKSQPHASTKTWGSGLSWGNKGDMQFNQWYSVKQYIKLNTPGQNNGILRVWVNGKLANEFTDINFRRTKDLKIYAYWFNYYNGGPNTIRETGHVRIDDFKLYLNGTNDISVTGISVNSTSASIAVNGTKKLNKTISPSNATNKSVTWSSSNTSVATVSNNGLVKAVSAGIATITVKTNDGNKTATSVITVTAGGGSGTTATTTFSPIHDAYLQGTSRNDNALIRVEAGKRVGYLQYDLSGISGTITSAKLKLKCNGDKGNGTINIALGNSNSWTESNLSSSNKPSSTSTLATKNSTYSVGTTYTWTLDANALTTGGKLSLIITQIDGNDVAFSSKEGTTTAPQLEITYESSGTSSKVLNTKAEIKNLDASIYPTPFNDELNIRFNKGSVQKVNIMNIHGQIVYSKKLSKNTNQLKIESLNHLSKGIYFLNLTNIEGQIKMMKIIK